MGAERRRACEGQRATTREVNTVSYAAGAELTLLGLPSSAAIAILDAVDAFAARGTGFVRRMLDGSEELRLYVDDHYVTFVKVGNVVHVLAISRRG